MIKHVVMMKFRPEVTDEQIAAIEKGLGRLPGIIPEIKGYEFGRDVMRSERSFDFCLVSMFENMETLKVYAVHPDHRKVVELITAAAEKLVSADFEC